MQPKNTRRIRGPAVVAVFVLLVSLGVVGGWLVLRQHPQPTRIIDVLNLDGEHAVIVRDVRGPDPRSFISLYEREHGERWGALIPTYPRDDDTVGSGARSSVAATGDVVFVRSVASGQAAFFAFSGTSGKKLGRIEPFADIHGASNTGFALPGISSLFDGGQAFEFSGADGEWTSVLGFALHNGTLAWRTEIGPSSILEVWLRPEHLVVQTTNDILVIPRATGVVATRIAVTGRACVTRDTAYIEAPDDAPRGNEDAAGPAHGIRGLALDSTGEMFAVPLAGASLAGLCGQTGTHTLLAIHDKDGAALVALDASHAVSWRLAVADANAAESAWQLDAVARHTPDRTPLSLALTRFVPVFVDTGERAGESVQLAMIDTQTGRMAWHSPVLPWRGGHLMSAQGSHYLYVPDRRILAVFDGATGQLTSARALEGWSPVWPRHIAGGRIWITGGERWAVLDADTLDPLPSSGAAKDLGSDVRDSLAHELGVDGRPSTPSSGR